ncbi:MAG: Fic family protein [Candidatus Margulisbacteria bacterium]|jgi:Fic family protein|nr:Fic family protein [Candidatus Margulisiibacteriota bacterium]
MDKKITNGLADIDRLKGELDALKPFDAEITRYFKDYLDAELTYNTNAIEGSTLSFFDTKEILQKGYVYKATPTREILEVINHRDAIRYLETLTSKPPYIVSVEEILNLHREILKGIRNDRAGKFRQEDVYIRIRNADGTAGVKNFPEWQKAPDKITALLQWLRDNERNYHPVILAAEFHYRFVSIHPFIDGNGRTSRLLMNLILLQNGYPYANIKITDREKYITAITTADKTQDMTEFYLVVVDALITMLQLYIKTFKERIIWK